MSNEELVLKIKKGDSVQSHLQLLYDKNILLIKNFIAPYTKFELEEDLLQEAFFGLYNAVAGYDSSHNVKFMTYARYWILEAVRRYILKYGSVLTLPARVNERLVNYNKIVSNHLLTYGYKPSVQEIAKQMNLSLQEVFNIEKTNIGVSSLADHIDDNGELSFVDIIRSNDDLENEVIDKLQHEQMKNEMWPLIKLYTDEIEYKVLREIFVNNQSLKYIAEKYNLSYHKVRDIKAKALSRLRTGKAKKLLMEQYEVIESSYLYRGGLSRFNHYCDSNVEHLAVKNIELEKRINKNANMALC